MNITSAQDDLKMPLGMSSLGEFTLKAKTVKALRCEAFTVLALSLRRLIQVDINKREFGIREKTALAS